MSRNLSHMDEASILRDAIDYIKELQEQERLLQAEIEELESDMVLEDDGGLDSERDLPIPLGSKKVQTEQVSDSGGSGTSPIEVIDLSVTFMGEKTMAVSLRCTKRRETMVQLCEVFETMKLKVITDSIVEVSGRLSRILFIEAEEEEKDGIRLQIETAIAAFNGLQSSVSI